MAPKIIIAGAPASGKGTQCEFIKEKYGVVHLSTGDMLRAAAKSGSDIGKQAEEYMDAGKLVTDEIIIGVILERLAMSDCVEKGWLLDGFPRTRAQADALQDAGIECDAFVFLDVPDDALIERVVGRRTDPVTGKIYHMTFNPPEDEEIANRLTQRSDDTEEKVKVRLEAFHKNISSIIDCYTDVMVKIIGTGDKHTIFKLASGFIDAQIEFGVSDFAKSLELFQAADATSAETKCAALIGMARCNVEMGEFETARKLVAESNGIDESLSKGGISILAAIDDKVPPKPFEGKRGLKLIIAGAPASGKGTQCEIIKEKFGVVHLSTGDMLRAAAAAGTSVGLQAKQFMDAGKLVTDEIIIGVVKERLTKSDCVEKGWLLDGFPRTRAQADALQDAGIECDAFVFLDVPDDALIERVVGRRTDPVTGKIYHMTFNPPEDEEIANRLTQRSDDTEEKVKVRLEAFHDNLDAIMDCYTDKLFYVSGNQDKRKISDQIVSHCTALDKFQVVFVLGGPGSGKGTQCARIKEEFGYVHLSAGDLLREERKSGGDTGDLINNYIKEGKIVPAEITVGLLKKAMEKSGKKKFLIDGFPRSKENLDSFYDVMGSDFTLNMVLVFHCPEEVLQERLLKRGETSGRSDDNLESIKKRFRTFHETSEPVIAEFKRMGKVKIIDSVPSADIVYNRTRRLFIGSSVCHSVDRTLAMIKPDAMKSGQASAIIDEIEEAGFTVVARKTHKMTGKQIEEFYAEHKGKEFFKNLSSFMSSGEVMALLLEKHDAVASWRKLMGPTNVATAREVAPDSLRARYGSGQTENACHGSDSFLSAAREAAFWFPELELEDEVTLAMIKPGTSELNYEQIMGCIEYWGFNVVGEVKMVLSDADAEGFYSEHKGKSFFPNLVGYMTSGPIVALALQKPSAIKSWRKMMGKTNTFDAKKDDPWCLRALFGKDGTRNAVHGSDSEKSARRELGFFFNISRIKLGREPVVANASPAQMDAVAYLKEFVDPIFAPLLQRILSSRPSDVAQFVCGDLASGGN